MLKISLRPMEYKSKLIKIVLSQILFLFFVSPLDAKEHSITIAGSTTILPVSEKWAKSYKSKTGIIVNVHGGGSTSGIHATKNGTADIGASSRELSLKEKQNLKEIIVGKDALVIIVNKKNPINEITIDQARGIYIGRITNWKELGGEDKPIQVINRESGSGTRNIFEDIVMKITLKDKTKKIIPMTLKAIINNSNAEVKESVKMVPSSIGYVSVGFADNSVKSIKINSIEPTAENIDSGKYPIVRNLYFLVRKNATTNVQNFIAYVLSKEGQSYVLSEGYFPAKVLKN